MTDNQIISLLLYKYLQGTISDEESTKLDNWLTASQENQLLFEELLGEETLSTAIEEYHQDNRQVLENRIFEKIKGRVPKLKVISIYRRIFFRVAAAASIILIVGLGTYFIFFNKVHKQTEIVKVEPVKDVEAPKVTKAIITLADGRTIALDSLTTITEGKVKVIKTKEGKVIYSGASNEVAYNTLTNPRGSKVIDMQLPDGSHVWLNSGSSITYPLAVIGKERKVQMTGEAYFEVAHDAGMPFRVTKGETQIEVLGTHFDVNAYDDESSIKVTLLEGSVKVSKGNLTSLLKPGQQAQVTTKINVLNNVDLEQVMAWKNGQFNFNRTDLKVIMRDISRWYDVDVSFEGNVPPQLYSGGVPRSANLSEVLKALEYMGAHFTVNGRNITVKP